ncbi:MULTISPECIES: glycosyltransferase 87 family protein [Streptomyces]|uniref:Membrane protein n=1 Tax=Streptomyces viridochromogenes TaxID=1938 RepID=A0A0L8JDG3_STRVR|nr:MULTISPECIES: glycosyltransferase 87 family protein [Streptomyces]KOG11707.1 membrane protein [Streptomyces viridochromogenes]
MTGSAGKDRIRLRLPLVLWGLTRIVLLLCAFDVVSVPGPETTREVEEIYRGWFEVLRSGTYPLEDSTWQYPPGAALAILAPALLPFLDYATAFFVLAFLCDAFVFGLLVRTGRRPGRSMRGAWLWLAAVPLLGPTAYARYDIMVAAVAAAALLAAVRSPRTLGVLAGFGAVLKVWPALLLAGTPKGPVTWRSWPVAAGAGCAALLLCAAWMPGSLAFLSYQGERGTEVESLGAMVFHLARNFGWDGEARMNYGSMEFIGPYVPWVSAGAMGMTVAAFGWLAVWRFKARRFVSSTMADAAFVAVLLFTVTSRVISPQYMIWLVGLAAVCLAYRSSRMRRPAHLVLWATAVTQFEYPVWFWHVTESDPLGIAVLFLRNGLLVAAAFAACRTLWRHTVTEAGVVRIPVPADLPEREKVLTGSARSHG